MATSQIHGHQRSLTEDNKRPLLPQMRSRSNTSTSSSDIPFARKALSPNLSLDSSPRDSFDRPRGRQPRVERPDSIRRTIVSKSSKLFKSRPSSRDNLTSLQPLDWSDEFENDICPAPEPKTPSRPTSRHFRRPSKNDGEKVFLEKDRNEANLKTDAICRYNISEPFNFQHLTHTEPTQYKRMEAAGPNDFVSEFSAMRASQAPRRELQGIRADIIIPRDELYLNEPDWESSSLQGLGEESPPSTSYRFDDQFEDGPYMSPSPPPSLHHARSIDNFSQISPILPRDPVGSPVNTTSPRHFAPDFFTDHQQSPPAFEEFPTLKKSGYKTLESQDYPASEWSNGTCDSYAPHAVTTPDDEAHTLRPPPFQMVRTELSRVIEEDEFSEGRRSIATVSTLRPSTPNSALRPSRSFPNLRQGPLAKNTHGYSTSITIDTRITMARPSSIFEQVSSDIPERPKSAELVVIKEQETTWEDAVDWCYDNEAEANCDFDWHQEPSADAVHATIEDDSVVRAENDSPTGSIKTTLLPCPVRVPYRSSSIYSMLSPARLPQRASSIYSALPPTPARFPQRASSIYSSAPTLVVPSPSFVPDLDPPSAVSGSSSLDSVSEAVTPREGSIGDIRQSQHVLTATCKPTCRDWTEQTPSPPTDDPDAVMVYEDLYHVIYARKSQPEPVFDFGQVDGSTISSISPRSSRSAISKKSSQESVWSRHNRHSSSASIAESFSNKAVDAPSDQPSDRLHTLEATVTCADAGQAAAYRRRSRSLAREAARNSVRSKVKSQDSFTSDSDEHLPYDILSRDRSGSDASLRSYELQSHARPQSGRTRSGSSAASIRSTNSSHMNNHFPAGPLVR